MESSLPWSRGSAAACSRWAASLVSRVMKRFSFQETAHSVWRPWSRPSHRSTVSLDLLAQWRGLENNGQFLFTPPTHVLLVFSRALAELEQEGGVPARAARYQANHEVLVEGMRQLGFKTFVPGELQSAIITTFQYPAHDKFEFDGFYTGLSRRGFLIYPGTPQPTAFVLAQLAKSPPRTSPRCRTRFAKRWPSWRSPSRSTPTGISSAVGVTFPTDPLFLDGWL